MQEAAVRQHLDVQGQAGKRGAAPRVRQHMQRLFTAYVAATYAKQGMLVDEGFRPVEGMCLFWDPDNIDQTSLWRSTIRLHQKFFEEIVHRPVPVDMHVLKVLAKSRSPLAIDIYQWLTYRMSYLRNPTTIQWEDIERQLGGEYKQTRQFKAKFLHHLKQVIELYPQARVEPGSSGLKLLPSRPHVPMRLLRGRRR